jgi:hypothetical protein
MIELSRPGPYSVNLAPAPKQAFGNHRGALAAPVTPRKRRRNLWELPDKLLCPVIGTCLDLALMRTIGDKAGCPGLSGSDAYELHTYFIGASKAKSRLSVGIQKAFDKRYRTELKQFQQAPDEAALLTLWDAQLACGNVAGPLWALVSHPQAGDSAFVRAYEQVHMLSHQVGAKHQVDLAELATARRQLRQLRSDHAAAMQRSDRRLDQLRREIDRLRTLQQTHRDLEQALAAAYDRIRALESGEQLAAATARADQQAAHAHDQERRAHRWQARLADAEARIGQLESELDGLRTEGAAQEPPPRHELDPAGPAADPNDAEPASLPDLNGLRVLCVGGRTGLVEHYGNVVTRCNGEFMHHDGGLEDNRQRLGALLAAAQAVICVAGCVNHNAYYQCKRFCKLQSKPCVMLKSSGATTFARALVDVAA